MAAPPQQRVVSARSNPKCAPLPPPPPLTVPRHPRPFLPHLLHDAPLRHRGATWPHAAFIGGHCTAAACALPPDATRPLSSSLSIWPPVPPAYSHTPPLSSRPNFPSQLAYFVGAISANMDIANAALPAYVTVLLFFKGLLILDSAMPVRGRAQVRRRRPVWVWA